MQIGHEKTLTALLPALAGANLIYGLGMLESGITLSYGQLVADNEFAMMIKRVVKGIPVDDENLAVDVISQVGAGGNFISQEHTRKFMRTLQSQPRLIDRNRRGRWLDLGGKGMMDRAVEEAQHILQTHKPDPLPAGTESQLRSIIEEAEAEADERARAKEVRYVRKTK